MVKLLNGFLNTLGLVSLCALLAGGCATMSIREDKGLQKYPATAQPPRVENYCSGSTHIEGDFLRNLKRPGFYYMGSIIAENVKNMEEACSALISKAKEAGAQIVKVDYNPQFEQPRGAMRWDSGSGRWAFDWSASNPTAKYTLKEALTANLYIYDPDRNKKEYVDKVLRMLTELEDEKGDYAGLRDQKAFIKPEARVRWRQDLAQLKTAIERGRYSQAVNLRAALESHVDGCARSRLESSGGKPGVPDKDDWISNCILQEEIDRKLSFEILIDEIVKINALSTKDPALALRQYEERVDKWQKERQRAREEGFRVMLGKMPKLEAALNSYDQSAPERTYFWAFFHVVRPGLETRDRKKINLGLSTIEKDYRSCWSYNDEKKVITVARNCVKMEEIIELMADIALYFRAHENEMFE